MGMNRVDAERLVAIAGEAREAEEHLRAFVARQRGQGVTWAALGDALGVTRQAVQQRFGHDRARTAPAYEAADAVAR